MEVRRVLFISSLFFALSAVVSGAVVPLPQFNASLSDTTISGLSSGAYMSVQFHIAHSAIIGGAAIFAGGQYGCAADNIGIATTVCASALPVPPNPEVAISTINEYAAFGWIDPPSELSNDRVFIFTGELDTVVSPVVVEAVRTMYTNYVRIPSEQIRFVGNLSAAHTFPTDDPVNVNPCDVLASPFISNCEWDGAGAALNQIVNADGSPLRNPRNTGRLNGQLIEFDQRPFVVGSDPALYSLADSGYAFIPADCAEGAACRVHVSLHGCLQDSGHVGADYASNTGLNKWADTNSIVVIYPQTITSSLVPYNPESCWDWWGYNLPNYDIKLGAQIQFLYAIMQAAAAAAAGSDARR